MSSACNVIQHAWVIKLSFQSSHDMYIVSLNLTMGDDNIREDDNVLLYVE